MDGGITHVVYVSKAKKINLNKASSTKTGQTPTLKKVRKAFERYASGKRTSFRFKLLLDNYTDFQRKVYRELLNVKWGETITYGELANRLGTCARAVGQALKRNRHLILIPCHRVISHQGLGGFSQGL